LGTDAGTAINVIEIAQLSAAMTAAELKAASAATNQLSRYELTAAIRTHASLVSNLQFYRDWDGSAGTAVAGSGASPQTFTKNGTLVKNAIEAEYYYPVQQSWFHNSKIWTARTGYFLRNVFAKLKITTNATRLVCDFISGLTSASGYYEVGLSKNGIPPMEQLEIGITQTVRAADVLLTGGGEKTVELYDGAQSSPSGTVESSAAMVAIRVPKSATFSLVLPTTPAKRLIVYGDGSACGFLVGSSPFIEGWSTRVEREYPGGVTVEAYAERALFDDCVDGTARAAFVAHVVAMCDGSSENRLVLAIGHKDYGRNLWTAANFGTAYAALLDDLHTSLPALTIFCVTPTSAATETANGLGSTLGNYRTQITTAVSTRTSYCTLIDGTTILTSSNRDAVGGVYPDSNGHIEIYGWMKTLVKWVPRGELDYSTLTGGVIKSDIDARYIVPISNNLATAHSQANGLEGTHSFTQSSSTARPAFGAAGWDSTKRLPSWTHDGTNDGLLNQTGLAALILSGTDTVGWMVLVARWLNVAGQKVGWSMGKQVGATPAASFYSFATNSKWNVNKRDDANTLKSAASSSAPDTSKHRILLQYKSNGKLDGYIDEVLEFSDVDIDVGATTLDTVFLGGFYGNGVASIYANMEVARVLHGSGLLSAGDRTAIAADLTARYF
jgi:hypothetical protein